MGGGLRLNFLTENFSIAGYLSKKKNIFHQVVYSSHWIICLRREGVHYAGVYLL